jgi:hypothetical protein
VTVTSEYEHWFADGLSSLGGRVDPESLAGRYAASGLPAFQLRRLQEQLDCLPMPRPPAAPETP